MRASLILASLLAALLTGCTARVPAPVDDRRPAPAAQPKPPVAQTVPARPGAESAVPARAGFYIVKRGDTLYSIALENGVDYRELAAWNKLSDPTRIHIGQELRLTSPAAPAAAGVQVAGTRAPGEIESRPLGSTPGQTAPAAPDAATKTSPKAQRLPYSEQNLAALQKADPRAEARPEPAKPEPAKPPVATAPAAPAAAPAPEAASVQFSWPARGRLLAGFSEPNNKGLDIAGKPGDPVLAAAPGRVMYTGTGIRGYGKLIVIKHDDNYNSVYAHNREILVKEGQNVTRGQRIAELGDTDAESPRLHFEIRKSGKPVDPMKYLPAQ